MKYKICFFTVIIFCMFSLSSCRQTVDEDKEAYRLNTEVVKCLDAGDKEALKAMLNEVTRTGKYTDEQIDELFYVYEGHWVPDENESMGMYSSHLSSGNGYLTLVIWPRAVIETDAGRKYYLDIESYALSDSKPELLGINRISLKEISDSEDIPPDKQYAYVGKFSHVKM